MKAICKNNKQKCIEENSFFLKSSLISHSLPKQPFSPSLSLSHNIKNFTSAAQISSAATYWPVDLLTTPPGARKIWNHF